LSNRKRLQKRLTYRSQVAVSLAAHTAHWTDFNWTAGPVQVISDGVWGRIQIWAVSEAEGKRVIRHAAVLCGVDPDDPQQCEWSVRTVTDSRYGRVCSMGLRYIRGLPCVSSRDGPSGAPNWDV
jgi:hypothetical protein